MKPSGSPEEADAAVAEILSACDVWDMTMPWTPDDRDWDLDILRRFRAAGFGFVSLTLTDWPPTFDGTIGSIHRFKQMVQAEASDWLTFGTSVREIEEGRRANKLVLGFHSQETLPVGMDLARVAMLYAAGIRHMVLAYNVRNFVADGCAEVADAGLSNFGRKLIEEMDRVGMIVDCSHTGRRSSLEAMELTRHPPIFSHSGVYRVTEHIRNVHDDQIRACAARGGVIGVVGIGAFLGDLEARTESMFRHIDYLVSLVGPEYVGIGTDHVADLDFRRVLARNAYLKYGITAWPDREIGWPDPSGKQLRGGKCFQPEQLSELVRMMLTHGYPRAVIAGILGANFRRVYAAL